MTSLETRALRVLLPGFSGTTLTPEVLDLYAEGLGGLCLFGSNTAEGADALAALVGSVREADPGAVVAVDEEGGDVTRLHAAWGSPVLGPAALGACDDLELTRAAGRAVGTDLATLGIDLDLGPVADVNTDPDNPVIGTRSFGADPRRAADHVVAWLSGLQEAGVAACVKHFPGHGDTAVDSHLALPTVDVDLATLSERELVPFAAAVEAGVAAVMTSHVVLPALDASRPATLSRPVLGLLRDRLGFAGLLVSDALDMAGASAGRGMAAAAVESLDAGADLLCLGPDKDVALVREIQAAIVAAVRSGRLAEERLVAAADRVTARWRRPGVPGEVDEPRMLDGARRALRVEGDLPDLRGAEVVTVDTPANIAVGEGPWGLPADRHLAPGEPVAADRPVVLQVRDAHRRPEVAALAGSVAVVVEWGWPGPYDGPAPRICTHGWSRPGAAAVEELLRKAGWDR